MVGAAADAPRESARELRDDEVRAALRAAYGQVTACVAGLSADGAAADRFPLLG